MKEKYLIHNIFSEGHNANPSCKVLETVLKEGLKSSKNLMQIGNPLHDDWNYVFFSLYSEQPSNSLSAEYKNAILIKGKKTSVYLTMAFQKDWVQ
jgi:hypothetical protein